MTNTVSVVRESAPTTSFTRASPPRAFEIHCARAIRRFCHIRSPAHRDGPAPFAGRARGRHDARLRWEVVPRAYFRDRPAIAHRGRGPPPGVVGNGARCSARHARSRRGATSSAPARRWWRRHDGEGRWNEATSDDHRAAIGRIASLSTSRCSSRRRSAHMGSSRGAAWCSRCLDRNPTPRKTARFLLTGLHRVDRPPEMMPSSPCRDPAFCRVRSDGDSGTAGAL